MSQGFTTPLPIPLPVAQGGTGVTTSTGTGSTVLSNAPYQGIGPSGVANAATAYTLPSVRLSLASTTTIYLVATITFAVSTMKTTANIFARRRR